MGVMVLQALSSNPNLQSLAAINDGLYTAYTTPYIKAGMLIDRDPSTRFLKAWACETSLNVLKVKIADILRPDVDAY